MYLIFFETHAYEIVTAVAVLIVMVIYRIYKQLKPSRIPGVPFIPDDSFLGVSSQLMSKQMHRIALAHAKHFKGLYQLRLLGYRLLVVTDKEMARHALRDIHGKGDPFHLVLFPKYRNGVAIRNTFNLDTNEDWKLRRNKFRHAFSATSLKNFEKEVQELVDKMISRLGIASETDEYVEIDTLFGQLTMDIICKVAFQYELGALDNSMEYTELYEELQKALRLAFIPLLFPYIQYFQWFRVGILGQYWACNEKVELFCKCVLAHLRRLRAAGTLSTNGLGMSLVEFGDTPGISDDDVISEIMLAFIAGHETTAHSLSWIIYSLCKYPHIQAEAHRQLDILSPTDHHNTSQLLPDYVEAVIKESMRKYPVAHGNLRRVVEPQGYDIGGVHVNQGDWLIMNSYSIQNLECNWGESVDDFIPERWLNSTDGSSYGPHNPLSSAAIYGGGGIGKEDLMFFPFSFGPRHCIGMHLALLEIRVCMAKLLTRFSFKFADENMMDEEYALERHLTMKPKNNLQVFVYDRST